jgi:hypothetical protein
MGKIGTSYDNALAEAFFAAMKRELRVTEPHWNSETDAHRDVFRWIACHHHHHHHHHHRRHSALGHRSPADYERSMPAATVNQPIAAFWPGPLWPGPLWPGPLWPGPLWPGPLWPGPLWAAFARSRAARAGPDPTCVRSPCLWPGLGLPGRRTGRKRRHRGRGRQVPGEEAGTRWSARTERERDRSAYRGRRFGGV